MIVQNLLRLAARILPRDTNKTAWCMCMPCQAAQELQRWHVMLTLRMRVTDNHEGTELLSIISIALSRSQCSVDTGMDSHVMKPTRWFQTVFKASQPIGKTVAREGNMPVTTKQLQKQNLDAGYFLCQTATMGSRNTPSR